MQKKRRYLVWRRLIRRNPPSRPMLRINFHFFANAELKPKISARCMGSKAWNTYRTQRSPCLRIPSAPWGNRSNWIWCTRSYALDSFDFQYDQSCFFGIWSHLSIVPWEEYHCNAKKYEPVSFTFWKTKRRSVVFDALTLPLDTAPSPCRNLPGTTMPSRMMKAQVDTLLPSSHQWTVNVCPVFAVRSLNNR